MWSMIWPILVVVGANTVYNITAKATDNNINPFASLVISYGVALVSALALFFITSEQKNIFAELGKANWATYGMGLGIVFLEFGYIHIYRAGWKVSSASLFANITLACVLLAVGFLVYKEAISLKQVIGMVICGVGLFLIA